MRSRYAERGHALIISIIAVLIMTVMAVGAVRYAYREVAGAAAGRNRAAISACAEAARAELVSQFKLLGLSPMQVSAFKVTLESATPTVILGGHYGPTTATSVQVIKLNPLTVGSSYTMSDLTNRILDGVTPYRVVVHCVQGADGDPNQRQLELEFGVSYGI